MEAAEVRRRELLSESAPSSPREAQEWAGLYFTSAPASPSRAAAIFRDFNSSSRSSGIPFDGGFTGGAANPPPDEDLDDFAFDFNGGASPLTADELFDHGMIRPLKLPPRLQSIPTSPVLSPKSPVSSRFSRSPRRRAAAEVDPFAAAIEETTRGRELEPRKERRRAARSLSPLRRLFDFHVKPATQPKTGGVKWRLKDLLLFRSASEGRATGDKDRVRKYTAFSSTTAALLSKKSVAAREDERGSSFRSMEGSARRGGTSAHERHYAANRAAAEEQRKKTMLPYRQSLFGFLSFNPAITGLTKGFSSIRVRHE